MEKIIDALEKKLSEITSVTNLLEQGYTPERLAGVYSGSISAWRSDIKFRLLSIATVLRTVIKSNHSIGKKDLNEMIAEGKPIEVKCHFCNTAYTFSIEELKEIVKK